MPRSDCCFGDPNGIHTLDCPVYLANVEAFERSRPRIHSEDGVTWTEPTDGTCGFPYPFRQGAACPLPRDHGGPHAERVA